jgi:hypothetical protein
MAKRVEIYRGIFKRFWTSGPTHRLVRTQSLLLWSASRLPVLSLARMAESDAVLSDRSNQLRPQAAENLELSIALFSPNAASRRRAGSTHRQDDLAFSAAGLQVGHRFFGFGERKDSIDDDFKLVSVDERGQIGQVGPARVHE